MNYPNISIAIATFNSERTLEKTLRSIHKQTYPKRNIEVLVIDGGSKDTTINIAEKYNCKIIPNPKVDFIYAKHIGFLKAQGKYLMYLDSDEVLENHKSLKVKYSLFRKDNNVKAIMPSGYKTPTDFSPINYYINEFGDPFSFFIYRLSQNAKLYIKQLKRRYKKVYEDKNGVVFSFFNVKPLPMIELMAGGGIIDLYYFRLNFPQLKTNPPLVAFFFYFLNTKNVLLAVTKNDNIIHYSSSTLINYLKKISSRIKNNIFQNTTGKAGFLGRQQLQQGWFCFKKYLFIPYSLSIIFPLIDSIYLITTRKNLVFLIHTPLCIYTTILILYYSSLKLFGFRLKIKSYGN